MTDDRGLTTLRAALSAEANDISDPHELVERARGAHRPVRRTRRTVAAIAASVVLIVAVAGSVAWWRSEKHDSSSGAPGSSTQQIFYHGVSLDVPSSWPVIDGAHARHGCSSTFSGQTDRVLLGPSTQGAPSCPGRVDGQAGPRADGLWMQPAMQRDPGQVLTTLPDGQQVYLLSEPDSAVASVWYRGVWIQIGVGPDPAVEQRILNSITDRSGHADSAVLGKCPEATSPVMPSPVRLTSDVVFDAANATMNPVTADYQPAVSASTVWTSFLSSGFAQTGGSAVEWKILLGRLSLAPNYRDVPVWLIQALGVPTAYGPCGPTLLAPYNAQNGRPLIVITTG